MTQPTPSKVRVVRYSGAFTAFSRGITPVNPYRWVPKHPLDIEWWWIDATAFCSDIGDVLGSFASPASVFFTGGDGAMSILATAKSPNNLEAGVRFIGGTPGVDYTVTVIMNGSLGADTKAIDIILPCLGDLPLDTSTPWIADFSNSNNSGAYYYL